MTAEIYDHQVGKLVHRLISFLGEREVERCLRRYRDSLRSAGPVFSRYYLKTRHPWWASLDEFLVLERAGKSIRRHLSRPIKLLAGDALKIDVLKEAMPESVKRKYQRDLVDDERAKDYLFELQIAWHFHLMGCNVCWPVDYSAKHSEFVAKLDGLEFCVECKRISVDAARKIRRRDFYRFAEKLLPAVKARGHYGTIELTLKGRLHGNDSFIGGLCSQVLDAATVGRSEAVLSSARLRSDLQTAKGASVDFDATARHLIATKPPEAHGALFAQRSFGKPVDPVALIVRSEASEPVLETIKDRIKKAAAQLDPSKPGFICCFLEGIEDLTELASNSGLQVMSNYILNRQDLAHVAAISYCSESRAEEDGIGESFFNQGLLFRNPNCKFQQAAEFQFLT